LKQRFSRDCEVGHALQNQDLAVGTLLGNERGGQAKVRIDLVALCGCCWDEQRTSKEPNRVRRQIANRCICDLAGSKGNGVRRGLVGSQEGGQTRREQAAIKHSGLLDSIAGRV
jgi:hypothetical protein